VEAGNAVRSSQIHRTPGVRPVEAMRCDRVLGPWLGGFGVAATPAVGGV
jgi:hypothetical protein